jgi:hypothetical protein
MKSSGLINFWTVAGAIGVALLLGILTLLVVSFGPPPGPNHISPAVVTLIAASTATPVATAEPTLSSPYIPTATAQAGVITLGTYVQITGTEGLGLRMRADPGLNGRFLFLSYDSEVFKVADGPREVDGHTWWYLVATYDETRAGWAAADYLTVVSSP